MELIKKTLAMATAAATLATSQLAFAEDTTVELYTWREQEIGRASCRERV